MSTKSDGPMPGPRPGPVVETDAKVRIPGLVYLLLMCITSALIYVLQADVLGEVAHVVVMAIVIAMGPFSAVGGGARLLPLIQRKQPRGGQ